MADIKISAITASTTAPVDTDVFVTVESMGGTPATKRKAWSVLKAGLKTYFDALYAAIGAGGSDGWVAGATWTYASAVTVTVASGAAAIYDVGDKIRYKEGGAYKYAYIITVADTLLTIAGNTFAGGAITDNYYSKASSPNGFPQWFAYTPTGISATNSTKTGRFMIVGRLCTVQFRCAFTGAITFTSMPTLPVTVSANFGMGDLGPVGFGTYLDAPSTGGYGLICPNVRSNGTIFYLVTPANASMSASVPITWANGDSIEAQFSYEI
jgi:hypothetical protein